MMGYNGYGYGMMGYGWGWIMMLAILALVVLGIIALVKYLQQSGTAARHDMGNKALDLLNERYARGEISEEEYKRKKESIKKT